MASSDPDLLQEAIGEIGVLVPLFKRMGLQTNTKKREAMVCEPGTIRVLLFSALYACRVSLAGRRA